jgi:hypothetical protein
MDNNAECDQCEASVKQSELCFSQFSQQPKPQHGFTIIDYFAMPTLKSHHVLTGTLACICSLLLTFSGAAQEELTGNNQECLNETMALENNSILAASMPQLDCNIPPGSDSCAIDFGPISADFEQACVDLGGQVHVEDLVFDCTVNNPFDGKLENADFFIYTHPSCHDKSCDATDIKRALDLEWFSVIETLAALAGYDCQVSAPTDSTASTSGRYMAVLLAAMLGIVWLDII